MNTTATILAAAAVAAACILLLAVPARGDPPSFTGLPSLTAPPVQADADEDHPAPAMALERVFPRESRISPYFDHDDGLGGLDPHMLDEMLDMQGLELPVPEGLDEGRIPGQGCPYGDGVGGYRGNPFGPYEGGTAPRPEDYEPAPGPEDICSDASTPGWRSCGGDGPPDPTLDDGGGGDADGEADPTDNSARDTGGGGHRRNNPENASGKKDTEVADDSGGPTTDRDSDPEGDDPDEFRSPVGGEIAESAAAALAPAISAFDPAAAGLSATRPGGQTTNGKRRRRQWRGNPDGAPGPGDGVIVEGDRPDELAIPAGVAALDAAGAEAHQPGPEPGPSPNPPRPEAIDLPAMAAAAAGAGGQTSQPPPDEVPGPSEPPRPTADAEPAATVMGVRGSAQRLRMVDGQAAWVALQAGDTLGALDIVRTGLGSGIELRLGSGGEAHVGSGSKLGVGVLAGGPTGGAHMRLKYGSVQLTQAAANAAIRVQTPAGTTRMTGPEGAVAYSHLAGLQLKGGMHRVATGKAGGRTAAAFVGPGGSMQSITQVTAQHRLGTIAAPSAGFAGGEAPAFGPKALKVGKIAK